MAKLKVLHDGQPYLVDDGPFSKMFLEELEEFYVKKEPVIGSNGWYFDRKENVTWYECFGASWWGKTKEDRDADVSQFKYDLELLSYGERPLSKLEKRGLLALASRKGKLKKEVRHLLSIAYFHEFGEKQHTEIVLARKRMMDV